MLKKQNIIFLGGRKANDPTQTKTSMSKLTRNVSSSGSKSGFSEARSEIADKRYQVRMDPMKPSLLRERNLNIQEGVVGYASGLRTDSAAFKEKQKEDGRPESIIERIEQQKKEFLDRERQRELERERYMQQLEKDRRGQIDKPKDQLIADSERPKDTDSSLKKTQLPQPEPPKKPKTSNATGLVGLSNIGNTCYMNSTLQCLFNIPDFNEYFITGQFRKQVKCKPSSIAEQYCKLITLIRSSNNRSETPAELKSALSMRNSQFKGYAQQDSQEFLVTLLESMGEDLSRVDRKSAPYRELTADTKTKSIAKISQQWWDYNKLRDDSIIIDFFTGQLLSTVTCSRCKNQSIAFDNFRDMSLSFKNSDSTLTSMLDNFFKEETLVDDVFCSNCKKPRESKRKLALVRLPKVLILQLKRFSFGKWKKEKIGEQVNFSEVVDLGRYMKEVGEPNKLYDLVGVVNHSGGIDFGHYTADCKNPMNGKWYNFNDSVVKESTYGYQGRYESNLPYLLFYYRRD